MPPDTRVTADHEAATITIRKYAGVQTAGPTFGGHVPNTLTSRADPMHMRVSYRAIVALLRRVAAT